MKIQQRLAAILTILSLILIINSFPIFIIKAEELSEETINTDIGTETSDEILTEKEQISILEIENIHETEITTDTIDETLVYEPPATIEQTEEISTLEATDTEISSDEAFLKKDDSIEEEIDENQILEEIIIEEAAILIEDELNKDSLSDVEIMTKEQHKPSESPAFHAYITFTGQGFVVNGTFTEFTSEIAHIEPFYSLDGNDYQSCGTEWNLDNLGTKNTYELEKLQNQTCLYNYSEPLKNYLDEAINQIYLRLHITTKDGFSYESQSSIIERSGPQPIPDGMTITGKFASSIAVVEKRPYHYYGKYQLTINADATSEEIYALLPDTLPVEIQLYKDNFVTFCTVDCPVKWKSLFLPQLTGNEVITIPDATEDIIVPSGTTLNTPSGIFQLNEPLRIDNLPSTDEVKLVLNVIPTSKPITGTLVEDRDGLFITFPLKPTGATSIQAYILSPNTSSWIEITNLSILDAINSQPSTTNSGYALLLGNNQEPYCSYLAAKNSGNKPTPFFVGIKIEGGVYNNQQLVLAFPDTYNAPIKLPEINGSGGNECNVGSDNKDDSTETGQRPNLPHNSEETEPKHDTILIEIEPKTSYIHKSNSDSPQNLDDENTVKQNQSTFHITENIENEQHTALPQTSDLITKTKTNQENQQTKRTENTYSQSDKNKTKKTVKNISSKEELLLRKIIKPILYTENDNQLNITDIANFSEKIKTSVVSVTYNIKTDSRHIININICNTFLVIIVIICIFSIIIKMRHLK